MPVSKRTVSETAYGCIPREGFYRELRESQLIAESMLQKSDEEQQLSAAIRIWAAIQDEYAETEVAYFTSEADANQFAKIETANGERTWIVERTVNHPDAMTMIQTEESNWDYIYRDDGEEWVFYESFGPQLTGSTTGYFRVQVKAKNEAEALEKGKRIRATDGGRSI